MDQIRVFYGPKWTKYGYFGSFGPKTRVFGTQMHSFGTQMSVVAKSPLIQGSRKVYFTGPAQWVYTGPAQWVYTGPHQSFGPCPSKRGFPPILMNFQQNPVKSMILPGHPAESQRTDNGRVENSHLWWEFPSHLW